MDSFLFKCFLFNILNTVRGFTRSPLTHNGVASSPRATAVQDRGQRGPRSAVTRRRRGPRSAVTRRRRGPRSRETWISAVRGPQKPEPPRSAVYRNLDLRGPRSTDNCQARPSQDLRFLIGSSRGIWAGGCPGAVRGHGSGTFARSAVKLLTDLRGPRSSF